MRAPIMNRRVKIALLGLMMWAITFTSGYFSFAVFGAEDSDHATEEQDHATEEQDLSTEDHSPDTEDHASETDSLWTYGIKALFSGIALALALLLIYRDKRQNYRRTAWEAGITWYVMLLLLDLIVLFGLLGLDIALWFPLILINSIVVIITIVVGYLLAASRDEVSAD